MAGFIDEYFRGWLLATINLSDIAAAGGRPLGLLTSLVLPRSMLLSDFTRLLDGIDDCCKASGTRVIGGNLKEGQAVDVQATALGFVPRTVRMRRSGCSVGDVLAVVGDVGLFWSAFGTALRGVEWPTEYSSEFQRNLLTPRPKLVEGQVLADRARLSSCMDNSDGLYPSIAALLGNSGYGAIVDFDSVSWPQSVSWAAGRLGCTPGALALGWGDWSLVCTLHPSALQMAQDDLAAVGGAVVPIGRITSDEGIKVLESGLVGRMRPVDSERFAADSWFQAGIEAYLDELLLGPSVEHRGT
jgi:thiamine-monophosphate kinase